MKKGLLSILAGALLVVGCQNYDDQFDSLESQINALASTVAGLSQVQSDLASLAGTVSSLATTVNGLGSQIDTAVADGLADITADVEAIEAAVANVASSEEVAAISDAVTAAQTDLDELLTSSNFYSGALTVNSPSTLTFALGLGDKLAIVNGNVTITASPLMDAAGIQEVIDNIGTVVGDLNYSATTSAVTVMTFDNIVGVEDLTVDQSGSYSFAALTSANDIDLGTSYGSKVTVVNFESLTTVNSISTNGTANTIDFSKATNIHLTALPRYGAALTLKAAKGSTILIDNLASVNANGLESTLDLTVEGAASLDFSKITDGDISATDVAMVTGGADHDGSIALNGVTKAVIPSFTRGLTITGTNDLEYLHVIGATPKVATGATAVTTTPNLDVTGQTALKTAIVDGTLGNVTLSGNTDLETLTFTASVEALAVTGASNLAMADLAGKAKSISVTGNGDLETLTITTELNTAKGNAAAASTAGSLTVTGNADLVKVASAYDPVKSVTISGNAKLAMIDLTGTELVGGATDVATVSIKDNALTASVVDKYAATDSATNIGAGSVSDESMISTAKTYLTAAVAAPSATGVLVQIDEVALSAEQATGDPVESEVADWKMVYVTKTVTTAGEATVAGQVAYSYQGGDAVNLAHASGGVTTSLINATLNSNPDLAVSQILSDANGYVAAANAVDITLGATVAGGSSVVITILGDNSSATNEAANANSGAASATTLAATDVLGLTVGSLTATGTAGGALTTAAGVAARLVAIWNTKYNGTSTYTAFTATDNGDDTITIASDESAGSRTDGTSVGVVYGSGTDTSTNPVIGYKIGALKIADDNKTASNNVIITLTSQNGGTDYDAIQSGAVSAGAGDAGLALTSGTATTTSVQRGVALSDAIAAVDGTADTVVAGESTNYLAWVTAS
jgi:hypothetical protein